MIERTSHVVASDVSLVFDQVGSRGSKGYAIILTGMCANVWSMRMSGVQAQDPTTEHLKLLMHFPPNRFGHVID